MSTLMDDEHFQQQEERWDAIVRGIVYVVYPIAMIALMLGLLMRWTA